MPRKEKKYHFIYKTTNLLSGKYYIGMHSTNNIEDGYMGSGKRLKYSLNKYGKENHRVEILEFFDSREELANREKEIVNLNEITKKECINLVVGGKGQFPKFESLSEDKKRTILDNLKKHSQQRWKNDQFRKKMSLINSNQLKKFHKEGKFKYNTFTGKKHKEETKIKIGKANSIKQKGENNSQFGTIWITNGTENKKIKNNSEIPLNWYKGRI